MSLTNTRDTLFLNENGKIIQANKSNIHSNNVTQTFNITVHNHYHNHKQLNDPNDYVKLCKSISDKISADKDNDNQPTFLKTTHFKEYHFKEHPLISFTATYQSDDELMPEAEALRLLETCFLCEAKWHPSDCCDIYDYDRTKRKMVRNKIQNKAHQMKKTSQQQQYDNNNICNQQLPHIADVNNNNNSPQEYTNYDNTDDDFVSNLKTPQIKKTIIIDTDTDTDTDTDSDTDSDDVKYNKHRDSVEVTLNSDSESDDNYRDKKGKGQKKTNSANYVDEGGATRNWKGRARDRERYRDRAMEREREREMDRDIRYGKIEFSLDSNPKFVTIENDKHIVSSVISTFGIGKSQDKKDKHCVDTDTYTDDLYF